MNLYARANWSRKFFSRQFLAGSFAALVSSWLVLAGSGAQAQEVPKPMPTPAPSYIDNLKKAPDAQRLFRLESDEMLQQRMAREAKEKKNPLDLEYDYVAPRYPAPRPPQPIVRDWERMAEVIEPQYLCYNRLYFEQLNQERYGWSFGLAGPLVSLGTFYCDLVSLPYHWGTQPFQRKECDTGYYLPGDRVPLMLYCPTPSLTGALAECATIGLLFVAFP